MVTGIFLAQGGTPWGHGEAGIPHFSGDPGQARRLLGGTVRIPMGTPAASLAVTLVLLATGCADSVSQNTAAIQGADAQASPSAESPDATKLLDSNISPGRQHDSGSAPRDAGTVHGDATAVLASLDTPCFGGETGRDVLSLLKPSYASVFKPGDRVNPIDAGVGPSALSIDVKYAGGTVTCHPMVCICQDQGCPFCWSPWVSVDVTMTFRTADGSFDEQFTASAWSSAYRATGSQNGSGDNWNAAIPGTAVVGQYQFTLGTAAQTKLAFMGEFNGTTATGQVSEMNATVSGGGGDWGP
jgi:hypothetical protein